MQHEYRKTDKNSLICKYCGENKANKKLYDDSKLYCDSDGLLLCDNCYIAICEYAIRPKDDTKKQKNNNAVYISQYKCRLCGEIIEGSGTSNINLVLKTITDIYLEMPYREPQSPTLMYTHLCRNGDYGLTDFLGYKKIDEE